MRKKSAESRFLTKLPILDSKWKKIGSMNVDFQLGRNSCSDEKTEIIEVYKEFLKHLKYFLDQAQAERVLRENYGQKIDSFYKKEIEDTILNKYFADFETGRVLDPSLKFHPATFYLYHHEDLFFDILEKWGPEFLRCPSCQRLVIVWVRGGQHGNINRLCKILKKLYLKFGFYPETKIRRGDPGKAIFKDFPPDEIKWFYGEIVCWLKDAKKNRAINQTAFNEWNQKLVIIRTRSGPSRIMHDFIVNTGYWILRIIEFEAGLKENFYTYNWAPNEMARSILAKFFGVSEEAIRSILYRKKPI